jgi:hypothetical protein
MQPSLLLGVAAGAVGLLLLFGGGAAGPRHYTLKDIPKLRQLLLEKSYLGRELRNCMMKQTEHSLFTPSQTIAFGVGLFTGVATLNPGNALKAARLASAALDAAGGHNVPCQAELVLTQQQLKNHDQTCRELGLPTDITYEQVMAIVKSIPGADLNYDPTGDADTWDRCVKSSGLASCLRTWAEPGHPKISYDPKTGLAIR